MNVTTLRQDQAAEERQDPLRAERAALAAAIAAEHEARSALDRAEEALRRGHAVVAASQAKLESALHHVEKAREGDARRTAAAVRNRSSGATPDASGVRRARLAAVEAEDDLGVSQGALAQIQEGLEAARDRVLHAAVDTLACRGAVLAPVCRNLIERARDAHRSYALSRALLIELLNDPSKGTPEFPEDSLGGARARERVAAPLGALRAEAERATMMGNRSAEEDLAVVAAAIAALRQAVSSLTTDAAVEIPLP